MAIYTYTPVKQTWSLKMPPSKRKTYLQTTVFFLGGGVMFFPGVYVCLALKFDSCNVGSLGVFFP